MVRQDALSQFERVLRALEKIGDNRNRDLAEYEDDVWYFFQTCWHLKDWIKNDPQVPQRHRDSVESEVGRSEPLRICADLANRSKHYKLTAKRLDANISKRNLNILVGPPGRGAHEYDLIIRLDDGRELDAITVAKDAVSEWCRILKGYGLTITKPP